MKLRRQVLLFSASPFVQTRLSGALKPHGIQINLIPPASHTETLESILGIGFSKQGAMLPMMPIMEPMMVMVGLEDQEVDLVLEALKEKKLDIELKAILTPVNQQWTPLRLYAEICREREAMKKK